MKYSEFFKMLEKKDHLINRLNTLTDEQKAEAIAFFNKHPNYESEIDWNRKDLTWNDFEKVINKERVSKSQIPNFVKEGKHYLTLYKEKGITIYQPLTYVASRYLASKEVAPYVEGKWCIAYQKEKSYWDRYSIDEENAFLFIFTYDTKYALQITEDIPSSSSSLNENIRDSLYDEYYDQAWSNLYEEYWDKVDNGEIDSEEYGEKEYIEDNIEDEIENIISSVGKVDYDNPRNMIDYLLSNEIITVWDADDNSLTSSDALDCLEELPGITLEQLFNFCQEASRNMYIVYDMLDEDDEIVEKLEQLKAETLKKEFWSLYKKSQKKGTPFVFKGDLTRDNLYIIDDDALLKKDSDGNIIGFKVKIDKLVGNFKLYDMCFEGMENFPTEVIGDFEVGLGKSVTKLENCPNIVGGTFDIRHTCLQTLEGSPEYVGGDFLCGGKNSIKSLEALNGAPAQIDGIFKIGIIYNRDLARDILNKLGLVNKDETLADYEMYRIIRDNLVTIRDLISDFLEKNGTKIGKYVMLN